MAEVLEETGEILVEEILAEENLAEEVLEEENLTEKNLETEETLEEETLAEEKAEEELRCMKLSVTNAEKTAKFHFCHQVISLFIAAIVLDKKAAMEDLILEENLAIIHLD